MSKSPKRNHTPHRQSPIGVITQNGSAQQLMLQGNVMLSSHRHGSERDGIDDGPGKYREYLRGNAEIDSSNATMRAYTPNQDGYQRGAVSKNKPHEIRHAVQVFSKRSGHSRGVKSKNSDIMSPGNETPLRGTSPRNEN